ncbi:MAG: RNA pseudouridine synthase, partial [Bacteroidota bacterium]
MSSSEFVRSTADNLRVLYEDNHLIAVNKRPGDIVQADKTGDAPLSDVIRQYIKKKYDKPGDVFLGTVHRLDRPVSGVVLYARTSKALTRLNEMFQSKALDKTYWAIVQGKPAAKADRLVNILIKDEAKNKSRILSKEIPGAKKAILNYKVLGFGDNYSFLEVLLETGRHHQIRVQLSSIGCVIKGDLKYGAKRSNPDGSI